VFWLTLRYGLICCLYCCFLYKIELEFVL
jgi:hypothetical protein